MPEQTRDVTRSAGAASAVEHRAGDEIGPEAGENCEVEQAGRSHDGGVLAFLQSCLRLATSTIVVTAHAPQNHPSVPQLVIATDMRPPPGVSS